MKRNKPVWKHRKAGTQSRKRQPYWSDDRQLGDWTLIVPQSVVGTDARTFFLESAVPAGLEGTPDDPTMGPNLFRWRLDTGDMTRFVYSVWGGWWSWNPSWRFEAVPRSGDVWYGFTAQARCGRPKCPMTQYFYSDSDAEIAKHRPGHCPLGVPFARTWQYAGRVTL